MKTVQKQYKNSTKTVNNLLDVRRGLFEKLWIMTVPLLFLFSTSCSENHVSPHEEGLSVVESRVTSFCDNVNPCGNTQSAIINENYVINGCTITVNYEKWSCSNDVVIKNMSYTFANSSACNSLQQPWNQYFLNGQSLAANEAMNDFYKQLVDMIENNIFANSSAQIVTFINTYCHTLCVMEEKDEEGNFGAINLRQVPCGTSCCVRVTRLVIDPATDKLIKKTDPPIYEGSCDPLPAQFDTGCGEGYTVDRLCDPACERLY